MGEIFADGWIVVGQFEDVLAYELLTSYHAAWTLIAGGKPVGLALGFWSHHDPVESPFMIVDDLIWFPWASPRNRVECGVKFFASVRDDVPLVEYAREEFVPFFEMIMRHGVIRRVGMMRNVHPGERTMVFETIPRN